METAAIKKNTSWIPVYLKEDGRPESEFVNLQECFRFLRGLEQFNGYSNNGIYKVINSGIDDDKQLHLGFTFWTTIEAKEKRAGRKTR
ncbi:hypothetical protein [Paenibacillus sp. OV219]|uniref:hypothetical protein n=1 Tax=Paenibacillus sp. OV219 TaxID=1884377 RepID=UPI0008B59354|nr:hypothetical protein [Paenibacillus sp. OV219]SEN05488.1 hypothetical protein SAMN05518847_10249 [Paenibacillus sp. OV219]